MPRQKLPAAYWQTGHVDAIRTTTIRQKHSLTGDHVRPVFIELSYCVDIDTMADFELAQQVIDRKHLQIDMPCPLDGRQRRRWPESVDLVVFDFDGESFIAIEQNPKTKSRWAASTFGQEGDTVSKRNH